MRRTPPLAAAAIAVALAVACGRQESAGQERAAGALPDSLGGLALVQASAGSEAAGMIAHLHRQSVAPAESYVGHYGAGSNLAVLYVSRFASEPQADSALAEMAASIGAGSSGFGHHKTFAVDSTAVHMVLGYGQVHFFFARDARLVWLAMAPGMARASLAQLLGVAVDAVPPLDSLLPAAGAVGRGTR